LNPTQVNAGKPECYTILKVTAIAWQKKIGTNLEKDVA